MKRKSRLPVVIRLARLDENRMLRQLAHTRGAVEEIEDSLQTLHQQIEQTRVGTVLSAEARTDGAMLATFGRSVRDLNVTAERTNQRLVTALQAEEIARVAVVRAKLRLRTLRRVAKQREASTRLLARRAEIRRLDEVRRGFRTFEGE